MLQCNLVSVHLGNLLCDVVPLVLHGRLKNVTIHISVLERQFQLLVRLLRARLEIIKLLNQNHNTVSHVVFSGSGGFNCADKLVAH